MGRLPVAWFSDVSVKCMATLPATQKNLQAHRSQRVNKRALQTHGGFRYACVSATIRTTPCRMRHARMQAFVYKSQRKSDTFVYLAARDDFEKLPEALRAQLGELAFVLEVALTPQRRLARENPEVVRQHLAAHGFHLQFPPPIVGLQDAGSRRDDG